MCSTLASKRNLACFCHEWNVFKSHQFTLCTALLLAITLGTVLSWVVYLTVCVFSCSIMVYLSTLVCFMRWGLLWSWRECWVLATMSVPATPTSSLVRAIIQILSCLYFFNYLYSLIDDKNIYFWWDSYLEYDIRSIYSGNSFQPLFCQATLFNLILNICKILGFFALLCILLCFEAHYVFCRQLFRVCII